ncbi:hypothetical protein ACFE04_020818 [Oxalis oulophora]
MFILFYCSLLILFNLSLPAFPLQQVLLPNFPHRWQELDAFSDEVEAKLSAYPSHLWRAVVAYDDSRPSWGLSSYFVLVGLRRWKHNKSTDLHLQGVDYRDLKLEVAPFPPSAAHSNGQKSTRKASVSDVEYPVVVPLAEPSLTVSMLTALPTVGNASKILSEIAKTLYMPTKSCDRDWPVTGVVPCQLSANKYQVFDRVYIDGYQDRSIKLWDATYHVLSLIWTLECELLLILSRAIMGGYISSQSVKKIIEINPYMLDTMAGGAADYLFWHRNLGIKSDNHLFCLAYTLDSD